MPLLSGFFSKDEILFRTFTSNNPYRLLLWGIGMVTSLLTATYMFRLVFLAFHGERRSGCAWPARIRKKKSPRRRQATDMPRPRMVMRHGHAHAPHDAPPSMAIPLIVLAIGSVVAGYVGVPHALKGSNRIERFLEPSFEAPHVERPSRGGGRQRAVDGRPRAHRPVSVQEPQRRRCCRDSRRFIH